MQNLIPKKSEKITSPEEAAKLVELVEEKQETPHLVVEAEQIPAVNQPVKTMKTYLVEHNPYNNNNELGFRLFVSEIKFKEPPKTGDVFDFMLSGPEFDYSLPVTKIENGAVGNIEEFGKVQTMAKNEKGYDIYKIKKLKNKGRVEGLLVHLEKPVDYKWLGLVPKISLYY